MCFSGHNVYTASNVLSTPAGDMQVYTFDPEGSKSLVAKVDVNLGVDLKRHIGTGAVVNYNPA